MDDTTVDLIWRELEQAAISLESGIGPRDDLERVAQSAIQLLLQCPPEAVIARMDQSPLPTRAAVSWLVFEADRIAEIDPGHVAGLRACWARDYEPVQGSLIQPAPGMKGLGDRPRR